MLKAKREKMSASEMTTKMACISALVNLAVLDEDHQEKTAVISKYKEKNGFPDPEPDLRLLSPEDIAAAVQKTANQSLLIKMLLEVAFSDGNFSLREQTWIQKLVSNWEYPEKDYLRIYEYSRKKYSASGVETIEAKSSDKKENETAKLLQDAIALVDEHKGDAIEIRHLSENAGEQASPEETNEATKLTAEENPMTDSEPQESRDVQDNEIEEVSADEILDSSQDVKEVERIPSVEAEESTEYETLIEKPDIEIRDVEKPDTEEYQSAQDSALFKIPEDSKEVKTVQEAIDLGKIDEEAEKKAPSLKNPQREPQEDANQDKQADEIVLPPEEETSSGKDEATTLAENTEAPKETIAEATGWIKMLWSRDRSARLSAVNVVSGVSIQGQIQPLLDRLKVENDAQVRKCIRQGLADIAKTILDGLSENG
jgi:hypothetical protein